MSGTEKEIQGMDINKRILQFLETEGLKLSQLADILDVPRSRLSHIKSGRNKPNIDFITKLLQKFPNLNPEWLLLGTGGMYKIPPHNTNIKHNPQTSLAEKENSEKPIIENDNREVESHINNENEQTQKSQKTEENIDTPIQNNPQTEENKYQKTISPLPEPERILILFPDHTFITYKERK